MRFATFNVLHGRPLVNGHPLPVQAGGKPFTEAIASLDADVLALQELDHLQDRSGTVDQALEAAKASGANDWRYAAALHGHWTPNTGWTLEHTMPGLRVHGPNNTNTEDTLPSHGIALLTRLKVKTWQARRLPAAPLKMPIKVPGRPGLTMVPDQPRAALAAVLEGPNGPFTAVALHLSFVPPWNIAQLLTIHRWIAKLPHPHILLGDLNLIPPIPTATLNTKQSIEAIVNKTHKPPWHSLARTPTYPSHNPRVQFDHILATGIPPTPPARTPPTPISDHRPVIVDLPL